MSIPITLRTGNCIDVLSELPEHKFDTCITDPPYELSFKNNKWDSSGISFQKGTWEAVLRVLKPGATALIFGGTRTFHRITVAVEDAGFEIKDVIFYVHAQGFPKSHNIQKSITKEYGKELGDKWEGYGTQLKPAYEPILVAQKPLDGTYANNAKEHGVAGYWIDGTRIPGEPVPINKLESWSGFGEKKRPDYKQEMNTKGRYPANLIHDGGDEVLELLPDGADRFFYCTKASKKEKSFPVINTHPTVKPLELMQYLVRLTRTPNGGEVLDPFMGSGTCGVACVREGRSFFGVDLDENYVDIAKQRIEHEIVNIDS